jgi:hypothetical protein
VVTDWSRADENARMVRPGASPMVGRETAWLTRGVVSVGWAEKPTEGLEPSTPALRERCSAS